MSFGFPMIRFYSLAFVACYLLLCCVVAGQHIDLPAVTAHEEVIDNRLTGIETRIEKLALEHRLTALETTVENNTWLLKSSLLGIAGLVGEAALRIFRRRRAEE